MNIISSISVFLYLINKLFARFILRGKNVRIKDKIECGNNTIFYSTSSVENLQDKSKLSIGNNSHIRGELFVYPYGQGIRIGNNCYIGKNSVVRAADGIKIGNSVLIAHNVTIIDTDSHEIDHIDRDESFKNLIQFGHPNSCGSVKTEKIVIEDNAWISYNVCILKGVTIGKGAIIGAGSVVTKNIPAWSLAVGNPAKIIKLLN